MAKKNQRKAAGAKVNQLQVLVIAGVVIAVVLAVVFLSGSQSANSTKTATTQNISPAAYTEQFVSNNTLHLLIDVRTTEEFASGYINGAVNIPIDSIANRLSEIPKDQPVVLYCRSGNRSAQAARILENAGYTNIYDLGGIIAWAQQGFPVQ